MAANGHMADPTPDSDGRQLQTRYARILASYQAAAASATGATNHWPGEPGLEGKRRQGRPLRYAGEEEGDGENRECCLTADDATLRYCPMNENLLPFKFLYIFFRGGIACIVPYMTVFLSLLSVSPSTAGVLHGLPHLVTAIVTPVCGVLADRFQCRKFILLLCMSLWLAFVVSVNFLQPLEPAACREIVSNLREMSGALPVASPQSRHLECMMNMSARRYSLTGKGQADTSDDRDKLLFSLLHLPDPFATSLNEECESTAAVRDHTNPISALSENVERLGDLFIPRVKSQPSGTSAGTGWLFAQSNLLPAFVKVFVLVSLGEVMHRPTMALTDTATLNELGEQAWDRYGWQRSFGSAGFAFYSVAVAFVLGILRFPQIICGLEIEIVDYRVGTVMFGGTVACAFGLLFACCFKFKYYTKAEYKFSNVLPHLCSCYYGSVILTAFVLAVCNGCVAGYLFWHLRNLGATEITLSLVLAVRAGSELLLAFHTPRLIGCFGHVELLGVGLLAYCVRFVCYACVANLWLVLPVEVLHGMSIALTWNILVSFLCRAVPSECMATLQGFLSGVYFGLGHGVGAISSGFLVDSYGAVATFYGFSFAVLCYMVVFIIAFKSFKPPRKLPSSYQMVTSQDPPW